MSGYNPIELLSGDIASFQNGTVWWQDVYRTAHYIRSA
jgi:hypothetical protein